MPQSGSPDNPRRIFDTYTYTATDLSNTLAIFQDKRLGVSSHVVIDADGSVYSLFRLSEGTGLSSVACLGKVRTWMGVKPGPDLMILLAPALNW